MYDKNIYVYVHIHIWDLLQRGIQFRRVSTKRIAIQWGLYLGSPVHGNYHFQKQSRSSIVDVEAPKVPMSEPPGV